MTGSIAWLATLTVVSAGGATRGKVAGADDALRFGLWGHGLALELPAVGLVTGYGEKSQVGWGHVLGAAVSWEIWPSTVARLSVRANHTYGGIAAVRYDEQRDKRVSVDQVAHWVGTELNVGGAYVWRELVYGWSPFVGVTVGVNRSGYRFFFDDTMDRLEAVDTDPTNPVQCTGEFCAKTVRAGVGWGWQGGIRGGVRLELSRWLATETALAVSCTRTDQRPITGTVGFVNVRSARENICLVRATLAVLVGL